MGAVLHSDGVVFFFSGCLISWNVERMRYLRLTERETARAFSRLGVRRLPQRRNVGIKTVTSRVATTWVQLNS